MKDTKNYGGIMQYGIPQFRLDNKVLNESIARILKLGIHIKCNKELGKDFTIEDLEAKYDAIFLAFGKNISLN